MTRRRCRRRSKPARRQNRRESHVLFIPNGTYLIRDTLVVKSAVGPWVYGESREGVVIRLVDDVGTNVHSALRTHPREAAKPARTGLCVISVI